MGARETPLVGARIRMGRGEDVVGHPPSILGDVMEEAGITVTPPLADTQRLLLQMHVYIYEGPAGISLNCSENHLKGDYCCHLTDEYKETHKIRLTCKKISGEGWAMLWGRGGARQCSE